MRATGNAHASIPPATAGERPSASSVERGRISASRSPSATRNAANESERSDSVIERKSYESRSTFKMRPSPAISRLVFPSGANAGPGA